MAVSCNRQRNPFGTPTNLSMITKNKRNKEKSPNNIQTVVFPPSALTPNAIANPNRKPCVTWPQESTRRRFEKANILWPLITAIIFAARKVRGRLNTRLSHALVSRRRRFATKLIIYTEPRRRQKPQPDGGSGPRRREPRRRPAGCVYSTHS